MLTKVIRLVMRFLVKSNLNLVKALIIDFNRIIGRGYGSESVSQEVEMAIHLLKSVSKKNLVVFDVGANVGNYTAELLKYPNVDFVYAFEPSEKTWASLNQRFKGSSRVSPVKQALGSVNESQVLYSDSELSGLASLSRRRLEHFNIDFSKSELVKVGTLSAYVGTLGKIPDFVKIDVEGHELNVLLGSLDILHKVKLIQFEFGGCNIDTKTYFQDFWYFFVENKFELYRITSDRILKITEYSEEDEYFKTTNYFALNTRFILS
jgi:FkbM family methyltransferase